MRIRALDDNHDWQFGSGLGSFCTGQAAIEENVQTRLLFFQNDFFAAMLDGIDWWNLLGTFNPAAEQGILLQVRNVIAQSFGVTSINSVDAEMDNATRRLTVAYSANSIYTQFSGSVKPS
jgi:hypothetical protein